MSKLSLLVKDSENHSLVRLFEQTRSKDTDLGSFVKFTKGRLSKKSPDDDNKLAHFRSQHTTQSASWRKSRLMTTKP